MFVVFASDVKRFVWNCDMKLNMLTAQIEFITFRMLLQLNYIVWFDLIIAMWFRRIFIECNPIKIYTLYYILCYIFCLGWFRSLINFIRNRILPIVSVYNSYSTTKLYRWKLITPRQIIQWKSLIQIDPFYSHSFFPPRLWMRESRACCVNSIAFHYKAVYIIFNYWQTRTNKKLVCFFSSAIILVTKSSLYI